MGRFTQEKNIHLLFDLMKSLDDRYRLNLVGYGYYQDELEKYAYQTVGLDFHRVIFTRKPPKKMIAKLYQEADLFVFTSQSETQGLVLVEAMAAGTPVIALKGPGQNDVVVDGKNGFLVNDISKMKEIINELNDKPDLLSRLSSGASLTAQRFHQKPLVQELISYYKEVSLFE